MSQYFKTEQQDSALIITINRVEVYNALNRDSKLELIDMIKKANKDDNVKSIILTGTGPAFCTGQDLNDRTVKAGGSDKVDLGYTLETEWNPLVKAIADSKKIVIAAINGVVAGAGLSVALNCDLIVAKNGVKFVSGFSKIGLCPDAGSTQLFVNALGAKKSLEYFLLNTPLLSEDLLQHKMINAIDSDPMVVAKKWSSELKNLAPLAVSLIKKNVQQSLNLSQQEMIDRETSAQRFLGNSKDYQEGLKAFFEKRPAQFTGE